MAPEILKHKEYDKMVDYWSYGIVLFEMLTGSLPYQQNNSDTKENQKNKEINE